MCEMMTILIFSSSQEVIIKLADFGFAKIDRGDLVTPQFTPYYVSPQVMNLSSHIFSNNAWATVLDWVIPLNPFHPKGFPTDE